MTFCQSLERELLRQASKSRSAAQKPQEKQRDIERVDSDILGLLTLDEEINEEIMEKTEVEEDIEEYLSLIAHALKDHAAEKTASVGKHPTSHIEQLQLPQLQLAYFNGDPTKWTTVWESFTSTINNN